MCNVWFMFETLISLFISLFLYFFIVCCLTPTEQKRRILKQKKDVTKKKLEIHLFQEKMNCSLSGDISLFLPMCHMCGS